MGLDFNIYDLPSVLILIIVDLILNNLLCCSYTCIQLMFMYVHLSTIYSAFINSEKLFDICIILHELFWIKLVVVLHDYK